MPFPVQTSERSFYNAKIIKESKARMGFFHKSRQADEYTTVFASNAKTNASKVTRQSLFFVRNTNQKEVQKALKIAVNMTTAVNLM